MKEVIAMRASLLAVLLAALSLAGCSTFGVEEDDRLSGGAFNPGLWKSLTSRASSPRGEVDRPVAALPPEGGRVVQVRGRRFANGLRQEIVHAGAAGVRGENLVEVTLRTEAEGERFENLVVMPRATDADIAAELAEKFPGVRMEMHSYVLRNAYGPYGLASGVQPGGATCVYVWQTIDELSPVARTRHISLHATGAALRVRLCQPGASVQRLARIASSVVIDPAGEPMAMPLATGGAPGDALAAATGEPPADPRPPGPTASSSRSRRRWPCRPAAARPRGSSCSAACCRSTPGTRT